jgi:ribulose-phosphate 3-epimerase
MDRLSPSLPIIPLAMFSSTRRRRFRRSSNLCNRENIWYYFPMGKRVLVAPSLLSADFGRLAQSVESIKEMGGDMVHLDIMDGNFVPSLTFGPKVVADLRKASSLPFDVHLMVRNPESFVESFAEAGADYLTFHMEATVHVHRLLARIRELGKHPGVSIVPSTPVDALSEILELAEMILVMTVNPGFGGQKLIPGCLRKVEALRSLKEKRGFRYLIEVDGGIHRETVRQALDAGAEVIVAGSAVFESPNPREEIRVLRGED